MKNRIGVLFCVCALAAEVSAAGVALHEIPATTNTPAYIEFYNDAVSLQVFTDAGGAIAGCTNLCDLLPLAPTNECVAWRCVRGRKGEKTLWLGNAKGGGDRIIGLTLEKGASPLRVEVLKPGAAAPLVREAYKLRLRGKEAQDFLAKASKTLRIAAKNEPLDLWNMIERAFLEDDGEDAAAKAALNHCAPVPYLLAAIDNYAELGAWGEIRELARQSAALAEDDPSFAHPRLESLAKMDEASIKRVYRKDFGLKTSDIKKATSEIKKATSEIKASSTEL